MCGDQLPAQRLPVTVCVGRKQCNGMTRCCRIGDKPCRGPQIQIAGGDAQIGIRTIHAERGIAAMDQQVLQLDGTPRLGTPREKLLVKPTVARKQLAAHEDPAYKIVHEGRMNPVPPKIARPREA